jgi:hypothetical protein
MFDNDSNPDREGAYTPEQIEEAYEAMDAIGFERLPQWQKDVLEWVKIRNHEFLFGRGED